MPSTSPDGGQPSRSGTHLAGAAAESARRSKAQREAEAAAAAAVAPLAEYNIRQAGGIHAVRNALGTAKALKIAALAGLNTDRLAAEWAASEPGIRQISTGGPGGDYEGDPRHDPRAMAALSAGGIRGYNRVLQEITPEYEQRAKERHARGATGLAPGAPQGFPDTGLPSTPGESRLVRDPQTGDLRAVPVGTQRSVDYASWEQLQAHDPVFADGATANKLAPEFPVPASTPAQAPGGYWAGATGCDHSNPPNARFCVECGASLPAAAEVS